MSPQQSLEPEELLAQVGWVRALALQVAGEPHGADDLAQQALLVALSSNAERPRSLRAWLAAVIGNLDRTRRRSEHRREQREQHAARAEAEPSTLDLVERASTQRALVGALLELCEPYRSTLLLRFFESCTPREVAARTGVPESTVATRTAEGLKRVRARLTRADDGPGAWLPSILPLLRWPGAVRPQAALSGALFVSSQAKWILGGALLVVALLASRVWIGADAAEPGEVAPAASDATLPAVDRRAEPPLATGTSAGSVRVPSAESTVVAGAPPATAPGMREIRGRVIDLAGLPVPGVDVCRVGASPPRDGAHAGLARLVKDCVESDADGLFVVEGRPPLRMRVRSERYTTVFEANLSPHETDASEEPTVVVAWRRMVGGVVVDEQDNEVVGAVVSIMAPERPVNLSGNLLAAAARVTWEARTDARGSFAFEDAAEGFGEWLSVTAPGFLHEVAAIPAEGGADLRVVLRRAKAGGDAIGGRVELPDGSPAVGALVSTGWLTAEVDVEGRFVLDLEQEREWSSPKDTEARELVAALPGYRPAQRTLPSKAEALEVGWPKDVVLQLEGTPLTIRGRVEDEAGNLLAGVVVRALDETKFGLVRGAQPGWFMSRTLEQVLGGGEVQTDAAGEFVLEGLLERDYRLEAMWRPSLLTAVSEPVAAGDEGARIVLDRSLLGRIAGRIVDRDGEGIPGVRISLSANREAYLEIGMNAVSGEDGLFALEGATTDPKYLRLEGDPIVPELFRELPEGQEPDALELVVGRRCYLQVDWEGWSGSADQLVVVDEAGAEAQLVNMEGNSLTPVRGIPVATQGLSRVFTMPDTAAHALLMLAGEEVQRIRLQPVPGELELIRP